MTYDCIHPGVFQARPNRFIAWVELEGETCRCHVPNTGRLRELLIPGARVWCQYHPAPGRKTAWTLLAVEHRGTVVNIDSQVPNRLAADFVRSGGLGLMPDRVQPERTFGDSRLDLYYEAGSVRGFAEVKGVTLNEDGTARFPDAPTERGVKHLHSLVRAVEAGYRAAALFVIQRGDVTRFEPNQARDPAFAQALREAAAQGVEVRALICTVTPGALEITGEVPVCL